MTEASIHYGLVLTQMGLGVIVAFVLVFLSAPYGRHNRPGWGPTIPARIAWIIAETPPVLGFLWVYLQGQHRGALVPLLLLTVWQIHYIHRGYIFPFRLKTEGKSWPVLIVVFSVVFNSLNAWINARWISHLHEYTPAWLSDPRFLLGVGIFAVGMVINLQSDNILLRLRKPGETGYKIPRGGMYRFVSCPNYLGELIEWLGWAVATWSLAGLAFFVFTAANLAPRAVQNHRWYLEKFGDDYPPERKALLPHVF